MKKVKYTPEMEAMIKADYLACETDDEREEVIQEYMDKWDKTKRMIVAKLSRMDIYSPRPKLSKVTGEKPATKEQIVRRIERQMNKSRGEFEGLEKAPKLVLQAILEKVSV